VVSEADTFSFETNSNHNLVANFLRQVPNYTVVSSAVPLVGGTTSIPSGTYPSGELVSITATPAIGYDFVNWTENGVEVSKSVEYTFTVSDDRILVANFSKKSFTISTETLPVIGGSTNITSGNYLYDEDVTLIATPADEYVFVNWTENGIVSASTPIYIFNVIRNRHLVANFKEKTYSVTAEAKPADGGKIEIDSDAYRKGDTSSVSATSNEGYEFVNWSVNGTEVSKSQNYSFTVSEDVHLTANFKLKKYEVKVSSNNSAWGYTNFASKIFNYGEIASVSAMPNWGCQFINWTENGIEVTKDHFYSFTVLGNRTLIANFQNINGLKTKEEPVLSIYPNPATDFISVTGLTKGSVLKLLSISGSIIYDLVSENENVTIDIRKLRKGIYLIIVDAGNLKVTQRIVIE